MKKILLVFVFVFLLLFIWGCFSDNISEEKSKSRIANPASVYCEEQGGTLEIRTGEGGQSGFCKFPNSSECEEWSFYRGECNSIEEE